MHSYTHIPSHHTLTYSDTHTDTLRVYKEVRVWSKLRRVM